MIDKRFFPLLLIIGMLLFSGYTSFNCQKNVAPQFIPLPTQVVNEEENLSFTVKATDKNLTDTLVYSCDESTLPRGAVFIPEAQLFKWTPDRFQGGFTYHVRFMVTDGEIQDSMVVHIDVIETNIPPQFFNDDEYFIDEGERLVIELVVENPDNDVLEFSALSLPEGSVFDTTKGIFIWRPDFLQSGDYTVHFIVSDNEFKDEMDIIIHVKNKSAPPIDSEGNVGLYTSLYLDKNNEPHISYYDKTNKDLKYAYRKDGEWHIEVADNSYGDVGKYSSIFVMESGEVFISYYDSLNGYLKLATRVGENNWTQEIVDYGGMNKVGLYTSLIVTNNMIKIAYYDASAGNLKLAYRSLKPQDNQDKIDVKSNLNLSQPYDNFVIKVVDSSKNVGKWASYNVCEQMGIEAISYFDEENGTLRLAITNDGGSTFSIEMINDTSGSKVYGADTSLRFTNDCKIAVAYQDNTNVSLKYLLKDGTNHTFETVDGTNAAGFYNSLIFDSAGNPYITYHEIRDRALKIAYKVKGSWRSKVIDELVPCGKHSSIKIDTNGVLKISYYSEKEGDLKYMELLPSDLF